MANKLRCSMHRRCLRYYYSFVFNNPPFSPFLRVTLLQTLNISGKPYHSKILKTHVYYQSYQQHVHYGSVALCAFGTSVRLRYLRPLRDSVCLLHKTFNLSLPISNEPFIFDMHYKYAT